MKRLRYFKTGETTIASNPFLLENNLVFIILHTGKLEFDIVYQADNTLIVGGYADTLAGLKKNAKSAAIAFGACFQEEIRKQTKLNLDDL